MFEDDDVDLNNIDSIKRFVKGTNQTQNPDLVPPSGTGELWELVDGIKFGQVRVIKDQDGEPVLKIGIGKTPVLNPDPPEGIYRILVKRFEDGTVRQVLIDFERLLDWQEPDE